MRKSLQNKILISLFAAGSIGMYCFANTAAAADFNAPGDGTIVNGNYSNVYGNRNAITIKNGDIEEIYGVGTDQNYNNEAKGGNITINNGTIKSVYGGFSTSYDAIKNYITINNGSVTSTVYGGFSSQASASDNHIIINEGTVQAVEGGHAGYKGNANDNTVTIINGTITGANGGSVYGGNSFKSEANSNTVNISGGTVNCKVAGGWGSADASSNKVNISGGTINTSNDNPGIYGGHSSTNANKNIVNISGGTINVNIYGGYSAGSGTTNENAINISNSADISNSKLFGGNKSGSTGNTLSINGWSGSTQSVQNFNDINFENIKWYNDGTVLNITNNDKANALANTKLNYDNVILTGGTELTTGNSMTLIAGQNLGIDVNNINSTGNFTAGVSIEGTGTAEVASDGNSIKYTLTKVKHLDQIDLVAENRAVAAAFVNQGTDLIEGSLDTLSRDGNYGVKTFAAVHGNRSKYDVNSDLKINGWSTIVGVGNAAEFADGDEFSWGVFYENGSGNYRTFNEFNNEFFRGDGSLVYNGGGIAARYENANGVYTEGSFRAGMLKSEMDNALRDGSGNYYGYDSESAYYGAHIGVGKIISLSESSDLDVYGKFFHTYTEGDSFTVAKDKFEFDSITSDRLRIGARITTNKANAFSTYYGLAYEYEFNGDADMRAQNLKAPTQSLQGSSYMAEVGFNYQPTPDSPWSFDLNMRGYAGEREGASFNVQATYTF